MSNVIILGAGMTGLYTARLLSRAGHRVTLIEKAPHVGGLAYSFDHHGFILDYGPHKIFSLLPGVMEQYKTILGDQCLTIPKKNALYLFGKYLDFPVRISQLLRGIGPAKSMKCLASYSKNKLGRKDVALTYEDYLLQRFGPFIYHAIFQGFAEKVWGDPRTLSEELARRRVPATGLGQMIKGLVSKDASMSADFFYYPKYGMRQLCDLIADDIRAHGGTFMLNSMPTAIHASNGAVEAVEYSDGTRTGTLPADYVISTIPITLLPGLLRPPAPAPVMAAAQRLRFRSAILVYLIVDKQQVLTHNWIFFPEKDIIFNRLSESRSFSPFVCPEGKTALIAEVTCDQDDALFKAPDGEIINRVIGDLEKIGVLQRGAVAESFTKRLGRIYPVYTTDYKEHMAAILAHVEQTKGLYTLGRFGLFNYNNTDHCVHMATCLSEHIERQGTIDDWKKMLAEFETYRIVD